MNQRQIVNKIKEILTGVEDALEDDDKIVMVRGYWEAGRLAFEHKKATGTAIQDLAAEIDVSKTTLQQYALFARLFPSGYPEKYHGKVIAWSLIREVLPVRKKESREFYLREACRHNWSKFALRQRIRSDYYGTLKDASAANQSKALTSMPRHLYTYAGEVIKVVDADTFDLDIDVGFKSRQEHRVRLRGINAPEAGTPKGQKAAGFVRAELAKCVIEDRTSESRRAGRPLVVVKTYKQGIYGRYIVDVYYLPGETDREVIAQKGKLLNQVLVDKGLARKIE